MCYAIPGKIVELKEKVAVVDYFGEHRRVLNEFFDLSIGDYVYAQGGILIQKVPESKALEILEQWKEMFFHLKEVDLRLARKNTESILKDPGFIRIIDKVKKREVLDKEEMLRVINAQDPDEQEVIYNTANEIRQGELKNSCCVHGIIEFSNYCRNNCLYCGIRSDNNKLKRYRMDLKEIVYTAEEAVGRYGFKALVLQSGDDYFYSGGMLEEIISKIKEKCGILLFMSVGQREQLVYKAMYDAGARGVLLRFETSNPTLFEKLHKDIKFKERLELLRYINSLGYILATGALIGLPGQSDEDLIADIMLTKSLKADMYSFGPLIPHQATPFGESIPVKPDRVFKIISLIRFVDPQAKILVTTALETLDRTEGRRLGLLAGANSVMLNVTPLEYRRLYEIYPDKAGIDKGIEESIKETVDLLYSLGRAPTDLGI